MKKLLVFLVATLMILGLAAQSHAMLSSGLSVLGTDSLGNQLIYDSALNVTWYDSTRGYDTWQNQVNWAAGLTVSFNGQSISGWRLPSTVDNPSSAGYNVTSSEMGHLYYTELGNKAPFDANGNQQSGWGLTNTGPFKNLSASGYWSGTPYSADNTSPGSAWYFYYSSGYQNYNSRNASYLAMAVTPGDVATPIPGPFMLFGSGLAWIAAMGGLYRRPEGN